MGLRKHILACGDLSVEYGSVILLEDDLYVSPFFYEYTQQALSFYENDDIIAGISLYRQPYEETTYHPFEPLCDNSDVFFLQFPSSLGQAWTKKQWQLFKEYYDKDPDPSAVAVPRKILHWPKTSWKKFFCSYLKNTKIREPARGVEPLTSALQKRRSTN